MTDLTHEALALLDACNAPLTANPAISRLHGLDSATLADHIELIRSTATNDTFPGLVLPRLTDHGILYYFAALSMRQWRRQVPLADAFAGPTITMPATLDHADPFERDLMALGLAALGKRVVPATAPVPTKARKTALRAIYRMAEMVMTSPVAPEERRSPLTDLLDCFELALAEGDAAKCESVIEQLAKGFYLDRLNILFLKTRLLAGMEQWHELRNWQGFGRLCNTRRPVRITNLLAKTFRQTDLSDCPNLEVLMQRFTEQVRPNSGNLLETLPTGAGEDTLHLFALHLLTAHEQDARLQGELEHRAERKPESAFATFWKECNKLLQPVTPTQHSFEDLASGAPTVESATALLVMAYKEDDPFKRATAVAAVHTLSAPEREQLLANAQHACIWHELTKETAENWPAGLEQLQNATSSQASNLLQDLMNRLPAAQVLGDKTGVASFGEAFDRAMGHPDAAGHLSANLPALVNWLREAPDFPSEVAVFTYLLCLETYALAESISSPRLLSFSELLESTLTLPLSATEYTQAMDSAKILVEQVNGAKELEWMLELMNMVVEQHAPDDSHRQTLLWIVLDKLRSFGTELSAWQLATLRRVFRILNLDPTPHTEHLAVRKEKSPLEAYSGRLVAIYTLDDNAGRRAREILADVCPKIKITVNSSPIGCQEIKHLAKHADIFVIAYRVAKHAATEEIKQRRPKDKPIIYSQGKGASSILRVLELYAESNMML